MIQRGKIVEMGADNRAKVDSGLPPTLARWRPVFGRPGPWDRASMKMEIMAEPTILETDASGELQIPADALGAGPRARFRLEHEGDALRLISEAPHALWET